MASPGIVWGNGRSPNDLATKISVKRNEMDASVERVVSAFLDEAVAEMKGYIRTRGVHNHVRNSSGRIGATGDMLKSVSKVLDYAKGNHRVRAQFGFLQNAPFYAVYQEYGTVNADGSERIADMLALTDAFQNFKTKLENAFADGSIVNLKQGRYAD